MNLNYFYESINNDNNECIMPFTHEKVCTDDQFKTKKYRVVAKASQYTVAIIDATAFEDCSTGTNERVVITSHILEGNENLGIEREMLGILRDRLSNCTDDTAWTAYDFTTTKIIKDMFQ